MNNSEVTCEGERSCISVEIQCSPFDRYFMYENEHYSHAITFLDEDTLLLGSHDPNKFGDYFIVASKSKKQFLFVTLKNEDRRDAPIVFNQEKVELLDIDDFGERWEGPTLEDMPFGWGKQYDEDGELVYEGFSVFGKYSLYGTEYDPGSHVVLYEGTWCDGLRCGRGESYDLNGNLLHKGEWAGDCCTSLSDSPVPDSTNLLPPISSLIVSLRIGKMCCGSNSSLVLQSFPILTGLEIGDGSFGKESEEEMMFACVDCRELGTIELGDHVMQFFSRVIITGENEDMK